MHPLLAMVAMARLRTLTDPADKNTRPVRIPWTEVAFGAAVLGDFWAFRSPDRWVLAWFVLALYFAVKVGSTMEYIHRNSWIKLEGLQKICNRMKTQLALLSLCSGCSLVAWTVTTTGSKLSSAILCVVAAVLAVIAVQIYRSRQQL
ncbi:MAG: hypothetical protein JNN11_01830 [Candidatus Doudnabacteria bacterium]|nr:hypothetical protein [Candidatus Doudnabacteria bacterium]